jgi:hypothetical protein
VIAIVPPHFTPATTPGGSVALALTQVEAAILVRHVPALLSNGGTFIAQLSPVVLANELVQDRERRAPSCADESFTCTGIAVLRAGETRAVATSRLGEAGIAVPTLVHEAIVAIAASAIWQADRIALLRILHYAPLINRYARGLFAFGVAGAPPTSSCLCARATVRVLSALLY